MRALLFFKRYDNYLLIASIGILLIVLLYWQESVILDIAGWTVFIDGITFSCILAFYLLVCWLIYRLIRSKLKNTLTIIHVLVTLALVGIFFLMGNFVVKYEAANDVQAIFLKQIVLNQTRNVFLISVPGIAFIIAQLIFAYNIVRSVMYNATAKSSNY